LCNKGSKYNSSNKGQDNLDTLAQLVTFPCNHLENSPLIVQDKDQINLQKRARAKAFTNSFLFDLIDLKSPLTKSYWNTFHCSKTILQEGKRISSRYCNNRWCLTCNRIRTAKMINGYQATIETFKDPRFVTLTIPNVKAKYLRDTIDLMNQVLREIQRSLKKTHNIQIRALRKYECTYNAERNDYHPHFHFILDELGVANLLVKYWVKKNVGADVKGQDITKADDTSLIELCKYFTKVIAKDNDYNPKALDIMFRAVRGKRTFQPIGIKKDVSEDIEEIQSQEIEFKPPQEQIWGYEADAYDWVSADGELFSEYSPTVKDLSVINKVYDSTKPK